MKFTTEQEAKDYFAGTTNPWGEPIEVEECPVCHEWSASRADTEKGDIIGPCVDAAGNNVHDRICESCDGDIDSQTTTFIRIADGKFYLDEFSLGEGEVRGFDGWDEQCDNCGRPISESGKVANDCQTIKCGCGTVYSVQTD